jgi:hypothetical protein
MNKHNCFARVQEHKRLPFLRLLFENCAKNCPTKLETVEVYEHHLQRLVSVII